MYRVNYKRNKYAKYTCLTDSPLFRDQTNTFLSRFWNGRTFEDPIFSIYINLHSEYQHIKWTESSSWFVIPHYWTENYNYNGYHDTLTLIIDSFSSLDDSSPIQFKWQNKNRIEDIVYSMTHLNKNPWLCVMKDLALKFLNMQAVSIN